MHRQRQTTPMIWVPYRIIVSHAIFAALLCYERQMNIPLEQMSLETSLRDFTQSIQPPPSWKEKARSAVDKVFEILKRYSKYGLDRCRIVGGFEKGTSTKLKVDVDTGGNGHLVIDE